MKQRYINIVAVWLSACAMPASAMVLGLDGRRNVETYASKNKVDANVLRQSYAASGIVSCGPTKGAGQIVMANDVIVTASHVFYDNSGKPRSRTCDFILEISGLEIRRQIDLSSVVSGSSTPYDVSPAKDWAVVRLFSPVTEVIPYNLASEIPKNIALVSKGHQDWGQGTQTAFQDCKLEPGDGASSEGVQELKSNCDTGEGASGGGFFFKKAPVPILVGILVGWRSASPIHLKEYSPVNYNLGISVTGAFRAAILAMLPRRIAARK